MHKGLLDDVSSVKDDAIQQMFEYYIHESNGDPMPFDYRQKLVLFAQILGATAGAYIVPPAWQYGHGQSDFLRYSYVLTNPLSGVLFLTKATADFFNAMIEDFHVPSAMSRLLQKMPAAQVAQKYTKIMGGSAVCAIPFGILTYLFPINGCHSKACLATIVAHSYAANLIMHALAWGFILRPDFWYYRIPLYPVIYPLKWLASCFTTPEEVPVEVLKLDDLKVKFVQNIGMRVIHNTNVLVDGVLKGDAISIARLDALKNMHWKHFINASDASATMPSICRQRATSVAKVVGGVFMVFGIIGWITSPFYLAYEKLHLNMAQTIGFGILPAYSTVVLSSFFGSMIIPNLMNYLTSFNGGVLSKLSFESRMFPKTFVTATAANIFCSAFAFAVGLEYINTDFGSTKFDTLRPILKNIALPALILISFVPLLDLTNTALRAASGYFLSKDAMSAKLSRLLMNSQEMASRMAQLPAEVIAEEVRSMNAADLHLCGLTSNDQPTEAMVFNHRMSRSSSIASTRSAELIERV